MANLTRIGIPVLLLIGLGAFVYVWMTASGAKPQQSGLKSLAVGEMSLLQFRDDVPAQPSEPIMGPDDTEVTLADYKGRIVVVNFWGTFCAPCVAEMPTLAELQGKYDESRLKIVPITADNRQDLEKARKELAELSDGRLDFFYDPKRGILYDSAVGGFPTTIIYGADGEEIARYEGEADWIAPETLAFFDAVLANAGLSG